MVGAISDSVHSLMLALLVTCPPLLVLSAIFAALGLPTVRRDTARMEAEWAEHAPDLPSAAPAL